LENLLRVWLAALQQFPSAEKEEEFLSIMGHHLEALPHLLTPGCIQLLNSLYEKQSLSNRGLFLKHIAWSGLPAKTTGPAVGEWLNWLTRLYQNNKSQCLQAFGLMEVVYWLVIHLENSQHECCPQHYLS
jgi:hypothetical protein